MLIGVLALQGAFIEHEKMLETLGVNYFEIRKKEDLLQKFDGLIIPGGESTVIGKLLKEKLNCEGITLVQNNDYGQDIKHYHLHVTPRYTSDMLNHNFNKDLLVSIEEIYNKVKKEG